MWTQKLVSSSSLGFRSTLTQRVWRKAFWSSAVVENVLASSWARIAREKKAPTRAPPQNFRDDTRELEIVSVAPWLIPHRQKSSYGGEDTYLITEDGLTVGVFDGVGGWADSGVNPREYSYRLMEGCKEAAEKVPAESRNPLQILKQGWIYAKGVIGSSTACVATFRPLKSSNQVQLQMDVVNVGDSGLIVVNNNSGEIVFQTKEQQHYFNCPYQLGSSNDTPDHGDKYAFTLTPGHTVVVGTDGLLDNLFVEQIATIVKEHKEETTQRMAYEIAQKALVVSRNSKAHTPFTTNAMANRFSKSQALGGKEDDITVVVLRFASDVKREEEN